MTVGRPRDREKDTRCHRQIKRVDHGRRHDAARAGQVYLTPPRPQASARGATGTSGAAVTPPAPRTWSARSMIMPPLPLRGRRAAALAVLLLAAPAPVHDDPARAPAPAVRSGWVRPVEPGVLVAGFDPPALAWLPGHRGVDLAARTGEVVRAPADGVVTFAGPVAGRGVLVVTHDDGLRTSLEPVEPTVPRGTRVVAGDPVATLSAEAGHCAPEACLHWGVRVGDAYVDPLTFLERPRIILLGRHGRVLRGRLRRARRPREGRAGAPSPRCASGRCATR